MKTLGIASFLAKKFGVPEKEIRAYIHKGPRRYRTFQIPKRNGNGNRTIAQPTRAMKAIQRLVLQEFLSDLPIHPSAMAYSKGKNIKDNADAHKANAYLLKMDFRDFFPSIGKLDVLTHVVGNVGPLNSDELELLTNIFLYRPHRTALPVLSIGAPSSPFLSNSILFNFDTIVHELCDPLSITYTRYADDLIFSSNRKNLLYSIPEKIEHICKDMDHPKLVVNHEKTVFSSKKKNRHITGLVITNDNNVSLGRAKKRYIKSLVHQFTLGTLDTEKIQYLRGFLSFAHSVEPSFINSLIKKYGNDVINRLAQPGLPRVY